MINSAALGCAALEFNSTLSASSTTRTMSWSATRPSVAVWCKK